jgi:8-oxo-dGTP pyrophosphatase MutT (NUDIX family)
MKQRIAEVLRNHRKNRLTDGGLTPSAVLVPLFIDAGGECHVLLAERSREVGSHKGQVCFPGGTSQAGDADLLHTALREADEEVGLRAEDVEVIGELDDDVVVSTGYVISPFVGFVPCPYPFKVNKNEIDQIFSVPLSFLRDGANLRLGYHTVGSRTFFGYYYEHEGHVIWGATARIIRRFTELLTPESGAPS